MDILKSIIAGSSATSRYQVVAGASRVNMRENTIQEEEDVPSDQENNQVELQSFQLNDVQASMDKHLRLMEVAKDEEFSKATDAYFTAVGMDNIFIRGVVDFSQGTNDSKELERSIKKIMVNIGKAETHNSNDSFQYNEDQNADSINSMELFKFFKWQVLRAKHVLLKSTSIDMPQWTKSVLNVDLLDLFLLEKGTAEADAKQDLVMRYLKNLIYKIVIFCECRNLIINQNINARDVCLTIIEDPTKKRESESHGLSEAASAKKSDSEDILRPFVIQKLIQKQVIRAKDNQMLVGTQIVQNKTQRRLKKWTKNFIAEAEKLELRPDIDIENIESIKPAVQEVIKPLIQKFIASEEGSDLNIDVRELAFVSIAKVFILNDVWRHIIDQDESSPLVNHVIAKILTSVEDKKKFFDNAVKIFARVGSMKLGLSESDQQNFVKEQKVCIIRALPDMLDLLKLCQPTDNIQTFQKILTDLKELVNDTEDEKVKDIADYNPSIDSNEATPDNDANNEESGVTTEEIKQQESQKKDIDPYQKEKLDALYNFKRAEKIDELSKYFKQDKLSGLQVQEEKKEDITNLIEQAKKETKNVLVKATEANKNAKACTTKTTQDQCKKANIEVTEAFTKAELAYTQIRKQWQAAVDMHCYFLQQIWLQNFPKVFDFYVTLIAEQQDMQENDIKAIIESIWKMPESPKSEIQLLLLTENIRQYLTKPKEDQLSVHATMLVAMGQALFSPTMTWLSFEMQNYVLKLFAEFINSHMNDFRMIKDRSKFMQAVQMNENGKEISPMEKSHFHRIAYFFLHQYYNWDANFRRSIIASDRSSDDIEKLNKDRCETKKNLQGDSDQYFTMVFELQKTDTTKKNKSDEESKKHQENKTSTYSDMPQCIQKSYEYIDDVDEINFLVFYCSVQYFNNQEKMLNLMKKKKNMIYMLTNLHTNLVEKVDAFKFKKPFKTQGITTLYYSLTNFCIHLSEMLLEYQQKNLKQVQEQKPIFVSTWLIMFQIYILKTKTDLSLFTSKQDNQQQYENQDALQVIYEASQQETDKLFEALLLFWKQTLDIGIKRSFKKSDDQKVKKANKKTFQDNKKLLLPSKEIVNNIRTKQIPEMIKLICKEAQLIEYNDSIKADQSIDPKELRTLKNLLMFVILYTRLIFEEKNLVNHRKENKNDCRLDSEIMRENHKENKNNPKMIDLLSILVKISEEFLKFATSESNEEQTYYYCELYWQTAMDQTNYLDACGKDECSQCMPEHERYESFLVNEIGDAIYKIGNSNKTQYGGTTYLTEHEAAQFTQVNNNTANRGMSTISFSRDSVNMSQMGNTTNIRASRFATSKKHLGNNNQSQLQEYIQEVFENFREVERRIFFVKQSVEVTREISQEKKSEEDADTYDQRIKNITQIMNKLRQTKIKLNLAKQENDLQNNHLSQLKEDGNKDFAHLIQQYEEEKMIRDEKIKKLQTKFKEWTVEQEKIQNVAILDASDSDSDSDSDDSNKKVKEPNEKPPRNEFHEAFCDYMLLKVKIKHQLFDKVEDIIQATQDCMEKQKNLRTRVPSNAPSFMTVEQAFILNETIEAIKTLVAEKQKDKVWMENFMPKDENMMKNALQRLIQLLGDAGYQMKAIEIAQYQLTQIINHDIILKQKIFIEDPTKEKKWIKDILDELKKWTAIVAMRDEKQNMEEVEVLPEYCSFVHLQFYGTHFPKELTHNFQGFIARIGSGDDIVPISTMIRSLFGQCDDNISKGNKNGDIRVIPRKGPNQVPDGMKEMPLHYQDEALVTVCFALKPLTPAVLKSYQKREDYNKREVVDVDRFKIESTQIITRPNFTVMGSQNFKDYFYMTDTASNEMIVKNGTIKVNDKIDEILLSLNKGNQDMDKIQDHQWKDFHETYTCLTGNLFKKEVTYQKDWKLIKTVKFQRIEREQALSKKTKKEQYKYIENIKKKSETWPEIERSYVTDYAIKMISKVPYYKDEVLNIFKVPLQFPTGFFCQQIESIEEKRRNGATTTTTEVDKAYDIIQAKYYSFVQVENMKDEMRLPEDKDSAGVDSIPIKRMAKQKKICAEALQNEFSPYIGSDVAGGVLVLINAFFMPGGIHDVNQNNEQFSDILKLFMSLEKLVKKIGDCLDKFQKMVLVYSLDEYKDDQVINADTMETYLDKIDEIIFRLEEIRENCNMDQLLAENADEMNDDDSDWDV